MSFRETSLELVQLSRCEPSPVPFLLGRLIRIRGVSTLTRVLLGQTALVAQARTQTMPGIDIVVNRSVFYVIVSVVPFQLIA